MGTAAALALLAAPGAQAATQFGNSCAANSGDESFSIWSAAHAPGDPLPLSAPVSGVITSWQFNAGPTVPPGAFSQSLQVFRTVSPGVTQVVGESASAVLGAGVNTFLTRIPVLAGDLVGNYGDVSTLYCETKIPADVVGYFEGVVRAPSSAPAKIAAGYKAAVSAAIEPDVDGDAYGDETQDGCPQSAAYQTPCPVVQVDAHLAPGSKSVTAFVIGSLASNVKLSGSAKLGKGSTAKLAPLTKSVVPGKIVKFKLPFPEPLREKLKELGPNQKLTLKITASATNITGQATVDKLKAKLKGQG